MLSYVRVGAFSGSAVSLRRALAQQTQLVDVDLIPLARSPALLPARLAATAEAAKGGRGTPWTKTGAWSKAVQRTLERRQVLAKHRPTLFVQTLPALVPGPGLRYGIYTDRVGREGAAVGGVHASRFTPQWLDREEAFLRGAARVYVMGPSTRDVLVRSYGLAEERVQVVGAGPNAALGPPGVEAPRCRRLLFVGTQWALKGGPELLSAFELVRTEFPDLGLLVVGVSPDGPLPDGVSVLGRVPHEQMDEVYSRADAVVIPTHMEAFGIALVEALSKGLPCIGSTVGNQPWIIGDAGECVRPGAVDAIAAALERLVAQYPEYCRRARLRGAQLRERMTWQHVAEVICTDLLA